MEQSKRAKVEGGVDRSNWEETDYIKWIDEADQEKRYRVERYLVEFLKRSAKARGESYQKLRASFCDEDRQAS